MPPKAASTSAAKPTATPKKAASSPAHPMYKDMISDAISTLKERNGSSRQAIKKYIQSNFKGLKNFDSQFNAAIRRGVEKQDFIQPKGASGTVKLNMQKKKDEAKAAKKTAKPKAASDKPKKAAAPKTTTTKKAATSDKVKKVAPKATATKKSVPKEKEAPKTKAIAAKKVTKRAAPAPVEKPTVLTKTKSGRVSKGSAAPKAAPKKKAVSTPKSSEKKKSTPKKAGPLPTDA